MRRPCTISVLRLVTRGSGLYSESCGVIGSSKRGVFGRIYLSNGFHFVSKFCSRDRRGSVGGPRGHDLRTSTGPNLESPGRGFGPGREERSTGESEPETSASRVLGRLVLRRAEYTFSPYLSHSCDTRTDTVTEVPGFLRPDPTPVETPVDQSVIRI